ncbi:MAG: tetratricopeptide repeat protein [Deltaproteobacteria bacterium]|nr:tetratricopeptide repeat protein [Deltaproteobacteria bacterium]MBN2670771.1 tetratricopeptide repeat protein [Deltaproteobacteria bacterium]
MKPIHFFCVLLLAVVVAPSTLLANNITKAKQAFIRGQELFDNEQFEDASEAFQEAMRLAPNWKIHYNIAQCEAAAKRYGSALDHFEKYIANGGDAIPMDRMEEVLGETARLRQMVGTLEFSKVPDGSELFIDGSARAVFPLIGQIRLAVGKEHEVVVVHKGKELIRRKMVLGAMQVITLRVEESAEGSHGDMVAQSLVVENGETAAEPDSTQNAATAPSSSTNSPQLKKLKVTFWLSSSLAVVCGGMAVAFWFASDSTYNDFLRLRGTVPNDDSELLRLKDRVDTYDALHISSIIGAGVFAATAIVLGSMYLVKRKRTQTVSVSPFLLQVRF